MTPVPVLPAVPIQSDIGIEIQLLLALAIVGGLYLVYAGFRSYRVGRLVKNTATEKIRSAAVGRTELQGTAVPKEFVFDRPFTPGKCLYANYKVKEYRESDDEDDNDRWVTIFSKTLAPPFYLDDGTGEILIDADSDVSFEISDENSTTIRVSEYESPPERVQAFLAGPERRDLAGSNITETITDVLGSKTLTNSGRGAQLSEQAATAEDEPTEDGTTTEKTDAGDGDGTGTDGAGDGEDLGVTHLSRNELNRSGNVLETSKTDDDAEVMEDSGGDGDEAGLLGKLRGAAETVTDAVESLSGPRGVSGSSNRKRRYIEEVLPVGADTYVYGGAEPRAATAGAANEDLLVMREDPATGEFIVADSDESGVAWTYTKRAVLYMLIGLVVSAGALGILLSSFGL